MLNTIRVYKKALKVKEVTFIDTLFMRKDPEYISQDPFNYVKDTIYFKPLTKEEIYYVPLTEEYSYKSCAIYIKQDEGNELFYHCKLLASKNNKSVLELCTFDIRVSGKKNIWVDSITSKNVQLLEHSFLLNQDKDLRQRVEEDEKERAILLRRGVTAMVMANLAITQSRAFIYAEFPENNNSVVALPDCLLKEKVKNLKLLLQEVGYYWKMIKIRPDRYSRFIYGRMITDGWI